MSKRQNNTTTTEQTILESRILDDSSFHRVRVEHLRSARPSVGDVLVAIDVEENDDATGLPGAIVAMQTTDEQPTLDGFVAWFRVKRPDLFIDPRNS